MMSDNRGGDGGQLDPNKTSKKKMVVKKKKRLHHRNRRREQEREMKGEKAEMMMMMRKRKKKIFPSVNVVIIVLLLGLVQLVEPTVNHNRWRSSSDDLNKMWDAATPNPTGSLSGPWIDPSGSGDVTGVAGKISHLVCRVKNLGSNQTVTWVRHADTHPLTVGLFTFTPDRRFTAIHRSNAEDWVLEIRNTSVTDIGAYECQVSTTPIRSHVLHLKVAEPLITLSGAPELHIKHGSRINLTCQIDNYPKSIYYLTWYKDGKSLLGSQRHQVSPLSSSSDSASPSSSSSSFSSSLVIEAASPTDNGVYYCSSAAGDSPVTSVHVITGETRAELQENGASRPSQQIFAIIVTMMILLSVETTAIITAVSPSFTLSSPLQ